MTAPLLDDAARRVLDALDRAGLSYAVASAARNGPAPHPPTPIVLVIAPVGTRSEPTLRMGAVEVDPIDARVVRDGGSWTLSRREVALLRVLAERRGTVVETRELMDRVWGRQDRLGALYATVRRLRLKVETDPGRPRYIVTVRGRGVRLESDPPPES